MATDRDNVLPGAFNVIQPRSADDWSAYYELRWRILRAPWNQPRGSERDDLESSSVHLMIKDPGGSAIAVGRLHFNTTKEAQVRYMAVENKWRGRRVGSQILEGLEQHAAKHGAGMVVLNARDEALPFYLRHGYQIEGPADTLFGAIKHTRMKKQILEPR